MAKREIFFNDEVYSIEESVIEASLAEMKSRLVDDYSGSGTTIVYDGTTINVDSAKLATAASHLAATLNRFAGSGASIVVNGVTYGIDSAKLNSAKTNLGGALGEMAGVVEEEDELAGTWVFNNFVSTNAEREFLFNFTSNGVDYYGLKTYIDLDRSYMAYKKTNGVYSNVYNFNEDMGGPETWTNDAYKTITITSRLSEVTNGSTLLTWLKANATKQTESEAESVIGTWVFNDSISHLEGYHSCEFGSYGEDFIGIGTDYEGNIGGDLVPADVYLVYFLTKTTYDEVYADGWENSAYKTITIVSEPTDETFIAWLKANATKQTVVEPEAPEEPTEDELAGTWLFNSSPNISASQSWNVLFTYHNFSDINYGIATKYTSSVQLIRYSDKYGDMQTAYNSTSGWVTDSLKTIHITSKLSEVTNGSTLLTWLKANATKQGATNLITFTVDGTSFQAEEGMTWEQWLNSEYNTNNYFTSGGWVRKNNRNVVGLSVGNPVYIWNNISANTAYAIITTSGLGPEPA